MNIQELTVEAKDENLARVQDFLMERLDALGCTVTARMQIEVALEELFINVAHYAYANLGKESCGKVTICVRDSATPKMVEVTISDNGIPFNPLARKDPDTTLSAEDRLIGGLGIFMVKKSMDMVHYEHKDGQNIMTFRKDL